MAPCGHTSVPVRVDNAGTDENATCAGGDVPFDSTVAVTSPTPVGFRSRTVTATLPFRSGVVSTTATIPIPRSGSGVETLLGTLRSDEAAVAETDPDKWEEAVDDVVYGMFGITPEEQDVIEKYLETFRVY